MVCQDVSQRAPLRSADQRPAFAAVSNQKVQLPRQPIFTSIASLRELAYSAALTLIAVFREPDIRLFTKADDGFAHDYY